MARGQFVRGSVENFENPRAPATAARLWALVSLIRPKQWMKNGLVFAALLFSGRLLHAESAWLALLAFAAFSLASSSVYCLNDALDSTEDRMHPRKRLRPVASGLVSPRQAVAVAVLLAGAAVAVASAVSLSFVLVVLAYLGINLLYSAALKRAVLLDVMAIASGFVLRAIGGGIAIDVQLSLWFLVCVPLLSLFLAVAKRRHELVTVNGAENHRAVLTEYSTQLLDQMLAVLSAALIMAYLLYAKDTAKPYLVMVTSPLVTYGVFRYLYLVYRHSGGGSPDEMLLSDVPLLVTVALWIGATAAIIYVR